LRILCKLVFRGSAFSWHLSLARLLFCCCLLARILVDLCVGLMMRPPNLNRRRVSWYAHTRNEVSGGEITWMENDQSDARDRRRVQELGSSLGGLKEQGNPTCDDLVERPAKRDVPLRTGETPWPTPIHARNDSSLVFDQALKEIRT
jgi:hypothetical protein